MVQASRELWNENTPTYRILTAKHMVIGTAVYHAASNKEGRYLTRFLDRLGVSGLEDECSSLRAQLRAMGTPELFFELAAERLDNLDPAVQLERAQGAHLRGSTQFRRGVNNIFRSLAGETGTGS